MIRTRHASALASWQHRSSAWLAAMIIIQFGLLIRADPVWPATPPSYTPTEPLKHSSPPSSPAPAPPSSTTTSATHTRFVSRSLYTAPSSPGPLAPPAAPPARIIIHNETDLRQRIIAASGPSTTTLIMPAMLLLTTALPLVDGPLELVAAGGSLVSCSTSNFTALTLNTSFFNMEGLTWTGCGTVLRLAAWPSGTDISVTISACNFLGNLNDPTAVSDPTHLVCVIWVA